MTFRNSGCLPFAILNNYSRVEGAAAPCGEHIRWLPNKPQPLSDALFYGEIETDLYHTAAVVLGVCLVIFGPERMKKPATVNRAG